MGVVVDVGGRTLSIELSGSGFDYRAWFGRMSEELGVEVVVADDSRNHAAGVQEAGLSGQQCVVHMKRTLGRARGRLSKTTRIRFKALFTQLSEMVN